MLRLLTLCVRKHLPQRDEMRVAQDKNLATGDAAAFRYSEWMKDFWSIVITYSGALQCSLHRAPPDSAIGSSAYEFMRLNRDYGCAPSEDTVRQHINNLVGEPLRECGFSERRFDLALDFYRNKVGYKRDVFLLVWDATALLPALGYQSVTDTVVGLTIPDEQLGQVDLRVGESLTAFLQRISKLQLATQVEILLLVPLEPRCPPFLLAAFAQSAPQTMETLKQRMLIARTEIERRGAFIVGVAADGASGNFKLLRQMRQTVAGAPTIAIAGVPTLSAAATTVQLPAREVRFRNVTRLMPDLAVVDPVHLPNLLRNAPLRKNAAMRVGNCDISQQRVLNALKDRVGEFGLETRLGVRTTDFNVSDRMNFASAQRLFSTKLLDYLETNFSNNATFAGA